jgi:hypothetical protein
MTTSFELVVMEEATPCVESRPLCRTALHPNVKMVQFSSNVGYDASIMHDAESSKTEVRMRESGATNRRTFVAGCVCAGCACVAGAAQPSDRNMGSLKDAASENKAKKTFDIAYCGIYCAACELHLKGKKDGTKCKGCTHPSMTSKCAVFTCAKEKKVANCGVCDSFEFCEKLLKHHEKPLYRQPPGARARK